MMSSTHSPAELSHKDMMVYDLIEAMQPRTDMHVYRGRIYVHGEPLRKEKLHRVPAG